MMKVKSCLIAIIFCAGMYPRAQATLGIPAGFIAPSRYYDAPTGRFISPDTVVPNAQDPQSLNRYAYVRNNPIIFTDPDGHWIFVAAIIASSVWAGTNGHPFNSSSYANFNFQAAAIAAAASYAGQWGYAAAGMGFGGAIIGGAVSGMTGGGLSAAVYGGNVMEGIGQGMAQGEVSGIVNGAIGSARIFNFGPGAGGMQNPVSNMAGAYVSSRILGANGSGANRAARNAFWGSTFSNGTQLTYNVIHGPPTNGQFMMGRRLDGGGNVFKQAGTMTMSIFGFAHSGYANVVNGKATTFELDAVQTPNGRRGIAAELPPLDPRNSYDNFGDKFGTWWQPIDSIPSRPFGDVGPYNLCTTNCNNWTWGN